MCKILLSAFMVAFSLNAQAQKDTSNSNKITVFENRPGITYKQQRQLSNVQTIIKFNPLLFFNGDIPIYFERVLNSSLTFELAPGLTYDDYVTDLYIFTDASSYQDISGTKPELGYSFKADLKFFPGQDDIIDGIYLSPEIGFRHYSIDYPVTNSYSSTTSYINGHTNRTDIKLLLGHEAESNRIDNLYFDWYVGLGLRATTGVQYTNDYVTGGYSSTPVAYNLSFVRPAFYAGFKLGIGF